MKKIFFPLIACTLSIAISNAQEFAFSDAIAAKEDHRVFIETYHTKIEAKAAKKNIPFGIVAAIMSAQAGANTNMSAVLILAGWLNDRLGVYPETDIDWLNALTESQTGLFPTDRLAELAVAYEAATNRLVDINQLNLSDTFIEQEQQTEAAANLAVQSQELEKVNQDLVLTKEELAQKEQKLLAAEQAKAAIQEELVLTKEELSAAETASDSARQKVVKLRNDFQSHKANPNPLFKNMIDIKGGITFFKAENATDISNGLNVEVQYSLIGNNGIGVEAGVSVIQLSDTEEFTPFISPYLGFSVGKYDNTLGFSVSPRAYYFMNPMLEINTTVDDAPMTGRVKPTVMYGAGANVKLKLGDIAAFTVYASYMRGPFKIEETGMLNGAAFINTTKTNLNVFGSGIGLSFKL